MESNNAERQNGVDQRDRVDQRGQVTKARSRRRTAAKWKSGLMLTGLGAVVLGAGYLAGVNAPAVDATASSGTVARAAAQSNAEPNRLSAPQNSNNSDDGERLKFSGDDDERFFGDDDLPSDKGTLQFNGGSGSGSSGQPNQQFGQQFGGRRNRQFGGLSQQQPGFGGPVTRSRGS